MFVDATGNRYLTMFYNTVKDQVMRYRVLSAMEGRLLDSSREHCEVAEQCLRGNWDRAAEAMREHIENSKIAILNYVMDQNRDAKNIFAVVPRRPWRATICCNNNSTEARRGLRPMQRMYAAMKAITIVKPGQVEIREIDKPVLGKVKR